MYKVLRGKKHQKIRKKVMGTDSRPRLSVFKSGQHIYAQMIDDAKAVTLVAANDLGMKGTKLEKAFEVGKKIAELAGKKKIIEIVFDRGGFLYHGRVTKLAEGAREGGLKF